MKKLILAAAAMMVLATPAAALTLDQAQAELGGYYCDGSKCVKYQQAEIVTDLPDIVTTGTSHPRVFPNEIVTLPAAGTYAGKYEWAADGEWQRIRTTSRGWVQIEDGGSVTTYTCTRTKKVLTYNGPNTSRDMAWSIETTVATQAGACPAR